MSRTERTRPSVAVVGAGWAGISAARVIHDADIDVHIYESGSRIGGHSRSAFLNGVMFEPEGPHVFHTSNQNVYEFAVRHGMGNPYQHKGLTQIYLDDSSDSCHTLSWPPQVDELRSLPIWSCIEKELASLPSVPSTSDFESYCISLMGKTLYGLFIEGYTIKQWGRHPSELSSKFAPGRLDLRTDGNRRLFKDKWEFFPLPSAQHVIESMASPIPATLGQAIVASDLADLERQHDAVIITAALDDFLGRPDELEWRGVRSVSRYLPLDDPTKTLTPGYVISQPSMRVPYTRTVETKHASNQRVCGTVITEEHPGADARHYPVLTPDDRNEKINCELQNEIRRMSRIPTFYCGRLANYVYVNQDVAIGQGMNCGLDVIAEMRALYS